jgi:hypothetical protein
MWRRNTAIQHLNLQRCRLGSAGLADSITSGLYRDTSIKALVISRNELCELIRRNKTIPRFFWMEMSLVAMLPLFGAFAEGVRQNTTLHQLNLSRCGLSDQDISVLANALRIRNASLREINLNRNGITSASFHALFGDSTAAIKTLIKLSLLCNPIRSEGAVILADALGRTAMPSLKV